MTASARLGAWQLALLVIAVAAAGTVLGVWARATGSRVPDSVDITRPELHNAGRSETLTAVGAHSGVGAVLLVLAALVMMSALWRLSPSYRPLVAGYGTIACGLAGMGAVLWFLLDDAHRIALFGAAVQVRADTVEVTAWPWISLACFAAAALAGIGLVPSRRI